jgi:hypothetical protein
MRREFLPALFAVISLAAIPAVGNAKTVKECNAEWTANKPAIQAGGETEKAFITRCRADTTTTTAPLTKSVSPQPAPAPAEVAPTKANQFTIEAQAKAHCPGERVVWANTNSSIYHYAGTRYYGTTKSGAYMCERDTAAAGIRPPKNENPATIKANP